MAIWEQLWQSGAVELWNVPDRSVMAFLGRWQQDAAIRTVLDLGCGTGRHLVPLAAAGFQAIGVDHAPSGIAACQCRLDDCGLTATLQCAEMSEIPVPDGSLDGVIAFNSIYHGSADQLRRVVASVHAKMRAGGRGFFTLPSRQNRMYGKGECVAPHTYIHPGMFSGVLPNDGEQGIPHYFSDEADIRSIFAGFDVVSMEQRELHLASKGRLVQDVTWLRIPSAFFWNLEVVKR